MDVLRTMLTHVRIKIGDLSVRQFTEPELIMGLNEGKDELVKIIRQANEEFFETTAALTISSTTKPNYSTLSLPADFAQLRNITVTNTGLEDTGFEWMSQSDRRFRQALLDGGSYANGMGIMYYDFLGQSQMIFAPGADIDLSCKLHYIKTVPDMQLPSDYPAGIPPEHYTFIVSWCVCECMRKADDGRLGSYLEKLEAQKETIINSINVRQIKEPVFVVGFMEEEFWG